MLTIKDGGGGVTRKSLELWNKDKHRIGKIQRIEVSREALRQEDKKYKDTTYVVDYTFIAYGENGELWLSGCNSGYGGEGPSGTARILTEFGFPLDQTRLIMLHGYIDFYPEQGKLVLDGVTGAWEALKAKHLENKAAALLRSV